METRTITAEDYGYQGLRQGLVSPCSLTLSRYVTHDHDLACASHFAQHSHDAQCFHGVEDIRSHFGADALPRPERCDFCDRPAAWIIGPTVGA